MPHGTHLGLDSSMPTALPLHTKEKGMPLLLDSGCCLCSALLLRACFLMCSLIMQQSAVVVPKILSHFSDANLLKLLVEVPLASLHLFMHVRL